MADEARPMDFPVRARGRLFEDFAVGARFAHHWGRTLTAADAIAFATTTLAYQPLFFNAEHARSEGHPDLVVPPMLVLCTVVGMSVEDLSEIGGPFLGIDDLAFLADVHAGDTIRARSEVVDARRSEKRPGFGIVTWQTEGHRGDDDLVVRFRRANLVMRRPA